MNAAPGGRIPVWETVRQAYSLLWRHRWLHAKAIWPPIMFLVTAEVCYRKIFHGGDTLDKIGSPLWQAPWYWIAGLTLCWLMGLKFLLSFSISWRRHLALGEKFDPFFFKRPFWQYLGALMTLYLLGAIWLSLIEYCAICVLRLVEGFEPGLEDVTIMMALIFSGGFAGIALVWPIVRIVPFFTRLSLGSGPSLLACFHLMRGNVLRYLAVWLLAMTPVIAFNEALGHAVKASGFDVSTLPVALFESVFRQGALFVHFSLGASIGLLFFNRLAGTSARPVSFTGNQPSETE